MKLPLSFIRFIPVLLIIALMQFGCTTQAKSTNMVVSNLVPINKYEETVFIQVGSGNYTEKAAMAQISDGEFYNALVKTIKMWDIFQEVVPMERADYFLYASVMDMYQPIAGYNMAVRLTVYWKVVDQKTKKKNLG